jgi:hypothetical protein
MYQIARHIDFLRYLAVAVPSQRKQLLRCLSREQVQVISEICLNLLHGNIEISDEDFLALSKHKNILRRLAVKSVDNNTKRELMYRYATCIANLVTAFLKHFDKEYSESDSSSSSDEDSGQPQKSAIVNANASGDGEGLSETDTDTGISISAADSEAIPGTSASTTQRDARKKRPEEDRNVFDFFTSSSSKFE